MQLQERDTHVFHKAAGLNFGNPLLEINALGKGCHQTRENRPARQVVSKLNRCGCWSYAEDDQDLAKKVIYRLSRRTTL